MRAAVLALTGEVSRTSRLKVDLTVPDLHEFSETLTRHIRKEERELFERLQRVLTPEELVELGVQLDAAILNATHSCALPKQKR